MLPQYPILYDWIIVAINSICLVIFQLIYAKNHCGWVSFTISEMGIFFLTTSWNRIFVYVASFKSQPLDAFSQMLMLAPIVAGLVGTIGNYNCNFSSHDIKGKGL